MSELKFDFYLIYIKKLEWYNFWSVRSDTLPEFSVDYPASRCDSLVCAHTPRTVVTLPKGRPIYDPYGKEINKNVNTSSNMAQDAVKPVLTKNKIQLLP